jgi:hypothetical protein
MPRKTKTPVFFIATQFRNKPVEVSFYTKNWKHVDEEDVKKKKTKQGVSLYTYQPVVASQ